MVPNVFVNIQLMKTLDRAYNATKRCIQLPNGDAFIHLSVATIHEVFGLGFEFDVPLFFEKLEEEYTKMDIVYNGWNLAIHKAEKGKLADEDGPLFGINIFRQYL